MSVPYPFSPSLSHDFFHRPSHRDANSFSREVRLFVDQWRNSNVPISSENEAKILELIKALEDLSSMGVMASNRRCHAEASQQLFKRCLSLYAGLRESFFSLDEAQRVGSFDTASFRGKFFQYGEEKSFKKTIFQESEKDESTVSVSCPKGIKVLFLVIGVSLVAAVFFVIMAPLLLVSSGVFAALALGGMSIVAACVVSVAVIYLIIKCCGCFPKKG
ncbi:hypothetical protein [Chlamydiifrater phoenicopteri]|uniref:hypothetical protein n=1 Tax=Chlamydiifrater phoenicopteri TaxID=2681469 RepID=UPI001BCCFEDA|nr:hypothetical protein [Chlamydiifrater phoenicopteri]